MTDDIRRILEIIFDRDASRAPECRRCQESMWALIDAELRHDDATAISLEEVHKHISECAACRTEYNELKELLSQEMSGELADPPVEGHFDFSYLPGESSAEIDRQSSLWRLVESVRGQVYRLTNDLQIRLDNAGASIAAVLGGPQPELVPIPAMRKESAQESYAGRLALPLPALDISLSLLIMAALPKGFVATVEVTKLESGEPVERVRITGKAPDGSMLFSQSTDINGKALLPQMGVEDVVLEVRYQNQSIELPLTFTSVGDE